MGDIPTGEQHLRLADPAGAAAVAGVVAAPRPVWARRWSRPLVEVGLLATLYLIYRSGRLAVTGQEGQAFANAELVRTAERLLRLPAEAAVQALFTGLPRVPELANVYYVYAHFPVTLAFLLWGYTHRPWAEYRWARNLLVTLTMVALAGHLLLPLAPPRMFPELGFVDTMARWGPSAYHGAGAAYANQYAAMPSLHVGWALLIAVVVCRTGPRLVAALAVGHAVVTCFVVTVTANHWWLDGMVAAAVLGVALLCHRAPPRNDRDRNDRDRGDPSRGPAG